MLSLQKILYQLKILYFGKQDEILESELFYHDVPNHESVDKDVRIYMANSVLKNKTDKTSIFSIYKCGSAFLIQTY